jgi:hypothetical protein
LTFHKKNHSWREMNEIGSGSVNVYVESGSLSCPFEIKCDEIPWLHKPCYFKLHSEDPHWNLRPYQSHRNLTLHAYPYVVFLSCLSKWVTRLKTFQDSVKGVTSCKFILLFLCRFINVQLFLSMCTWRWWFIIEVPLVLLWSDLTVQDKQQIQISSEVEAFWDSVVPGISIEVIINWNSTLVQMNSFAVGKWVCGF